MANKLTKKEKIDVIIAYFMAIIIMAIFEDFIFYLFNKSYLVYDKKEFHLIYYLCFLFAGIMLIFMFKYDRFFVFEEIHISLDKLKEEQEGS